MAFEPLEIDDAIPADESLIREFSDHGIPRDGAVILAELMVWLRDQLQPRGHHHEALLSSPMNQVLCVEYKKYPSRHSAMLAFVMYTEERWEQTLRLCADDKDIADWKAAPHKNDALPRYLLRECFRWLSMRGIDFETALREVWPTRPYWLPKVAYRLYRDRLVDPERLIEDDSILKLAEQSGWVPSSSHGRGRHDDILDDSPANVSCWFRLLGWGVLRHVLRRFSDASDRLMPTMAIGLSHAMAAHFFLDRKEHHHFLAFDKAGPQFRRHTLRLFKLLNERLLSRIAERDAAKVAPGDPLVRAWLRFGWMAAPAGTGLKQRVDHQVQMSLISAANRRLAQLRQVVVAGDSRAFSQAWIDRQDAIYTLASYGTIWDAVKPLLLMFRASPMLTVTSDLRYWPELSMPQPPSPWSEIPQLVVGTFQWLASFEQREHFWLRELRQEMAAFLLERLQQKPKRKLNDEERQLAAGGQLVFIEKSPVWRRYCARAFRELHVNPGSEGHRILYFASQHDPDANVRTEVKLSYEFATKTDGALPDGSSPRRSILRAFWVLRWAHVVALEGQLDKEGARRTLDREVRRTQDLALVAKEHMRSS